MTSIIPDLCKRLLKNPDLVYPPVSLQSSLLEENQRVQLDNIRSDIRQCCESGDYEKAERLAAQANAIIYEGSPTREG